MRLSELKKMNRDLYNNLSFKSRQEIDSMIDRIDIYDINNYDYELVKMDLIGLYRESELKVEDVQRLFCNENEKEEYCKEISKCFKSKTFSEKIVNMMPVASISVAIYCVFSVVVLNSMPKMYPISFFDLIFWIVIAPTIAVLYRRLIKKMNSYKERVLLLFGTLCSIGVVCYLASLLNSRIITVNSIYLLILAILLCVLSVSAYRIYYGRHSYNYKKLE